MKRYKFIEDLTLNDFICFEESIKLSDLTKATMSSFTKKFAKETNKLMGNPTNHSKLVDAKVNRKQGYIDFYWVTERTPKYKDNFNMEVVNPQNWQLYKDNLYTIQLRLLDILPLLQSQENLINDDIEKAIWTVDVKVWDDTPMFHYQGANYNLSTLDGSIYPTDIPPKYWNKFHNEYQFLSKHSAGIFQSIKFYVPQMRQVIKKYLRGNKE